MHVRPDDGGGGFWVDVLVIKELENVVQPEYATAGAATLRTDGTLRRIEGPALSENIPDGWIHKGRDAALEQRMIEKMLARVGAAPPSW